MKILKNENNLDLKQIIEHIDTSKPLKNRIFDNKYSILFSLLMSYLISSLLYDGEKETIRAFILFFGISLSTKLFNIKNTAKSINEIKKDLETFIQNNKEIQDLNIIDFNKSIIENQIEENIKQKRKKVISNIALTKKNKIYIFKQIVEEYSCLNSKNDYINKASIFLLENEDLINEGYLNLDYTLNRNNSLIKKLCKKHNM